MPSASVALRAIITYYYVDPATFPKGILHYQCECSNCRDWSLIPVFQEPIIASVFHSFYPNMRTVWSVFLDCCDVHRQSPVVTILHNSQGASVRLVK